MKFKLSKIFAAALLLPGSLFAGSFEIDSIVNETVQNATIPIGNPGGTGNTTTWTAGAVNGQGRYIIKDAFGASFGLRVDVTNPTGSFSSGTDSLMVARTVNSQGLMDTKTLSIYVKPSSNNTWTADVKFSFFTGTTFTTPASIDLLLTSLDIDFNQKYATKTSDFDSNSTYGFTAITSTSLGTGYDGFTSGGDSAFNDPTHAVSSKATANSEVNIRLGHNREALYMFEFRDPSTIVPEAGTTAALAIGALGLLARRRRTA